MFAAHPMLMITTRTNQDKKSLVPLFQSVEYVCIDGMKVDRDFYQTSVSATCSTNNQFTAPSPWPICRSSK